MIRSSSPFSLTFSLPQLLGSSDTKLLESYEQTGSLAEKLGQAAKAIRYLEPLLERLKQTQMVQPDSSQLRRMQRVTASLVVLTLRVQSAERTVALQRGLSAARSAGVSFQKPHTITQDI